MRKLSKKRAAQERRLRKVEAELDQYEENQYCFFFPSEPKTEYHHIIPKSQNAQLIDDKENLLPVGRRAHDILTFGATQDIRELPMDRLQLYLIRMAHVDYNYYRRFIVKLNL